MLVICVLWGVSAASTLTGTKGMWGQRTPEIGYFGAPNTLTNRCFNIIISIKYSHFPTSQQPSKWSRNSQHFRKNSFYKWPPFSFSLGHINPVCYILSYFFNILAIYSHISLSLLTVLVLSDFPTKSLYAFLFFPIGPRVIHPIDFIVLDLTIRRWEKIFKQLIEKFSQFSYFSLLGSIIFCSALLLHIFRRNDFLNARKKQEEKLYFFIDHLYIFRYQTTAKSKPILYSYQNQCNICRHKPWKCQRIFLSENMKYLFKYVNVSRSGYTECT
jgi:hypothetical protein